MTAVFVPDPAGQRAMLATTSMVDAMLTLAERVEERAVQIAPIRTGRYVNHFSSSAGIHEGVAYGRVSNDAHSDDGYLYPAALEWGTKHMRAQRILGRALDVLNLA